MYKIDEHLEQVLCCPQCGKKLSYGETEISCQDGHKYSWVAGIPCFLDKSMLPDEVAEQGNDAFERSGNISNWAVKHWQGFGLDKLIPLASEGAHALCVGGGDSAEKALLEAQGYKVASFDVDPIEGVDMLADAHHIPVLSGQFDLVTSFEVLEHLQEPWAAMDEIARVLKPGGVFVGSVAFLKPFHSSYFHMTHWAVKSLMDRSGMEAKRFYGVQNPFAHVMGKLAPLGPRKWSARLYNVIFKFIMSARLRAWGFFKKKDPYVPDATYSPHVPMSFADFDRLRYSGTVVFVAVKK